MSILIKNMEMPKRGETITVTICDDGLVFEEYYKGVFNAVSVPPHGRLIDADAFLALCREYAITPSDNEFCKRLEYALTKALTIIPAEKEN